VSLYLHCYFVFATVVWCVYIRIPTQTNNHTSTRSWFKSVLILDVVMQVENEVAPNLTVYVSNLNEKIKIEGTCFYAISLFYAPFCCYCDCPQTQLSSSHHHSLNCLPPSPSSSMQSSRRHCIMYFHHMATFWKLMHARHISYEAKPG
jgi:hypothetical protein